MKLWILILSLWVVSGIASEPAGRSSLSSHARGSKNAQLVIPVAVDAKVRGKEHFRDAIWAIRVESVSCDGHPVLGKPNHSILYAADFRTFIPATDIIVYRLPLSEFLTATQFDASSMKYELVKYVIPSDFREIVVCYHVVYPDGSISKLMKATSIDYNYFGLEIPSEPSGAEK